MPNTKLDVYKEYFHIENDGEALLMASKLISEDWTGKYEFIDDIFLRSVGIHAGMTRAQIIDIVKNIERPNNSVAIEIGHRRVYLILESRRKEEPALSGNIEQRLNEEAPDWVRRIMVQVRQFCEEPFFDQR